MSQGDNALEDTFHLKRHDSLMNYVGGFRAKKKQVLKGVMNLNHFFSFHNFHIDDQTLSKLESKVKK